MASEQRSDEVLMLAFRGGDAGAFNVLLQRHRRPVYAFFVRQLGDKALAEDLFQEVFLRIIRSAASYKERAKFTTWLYTIARNLLVDQTRRAKHRRALSLDQPLGNNPGGSGRSLGDLAADTGPGAERQAGNRQLKARIEGAVATLSDEQREVFLLRETLDLPFAEIAEIVAAPLNTVKSRMRYALEHLRRELEEYRDLAQPLR